jgi:hypothetical protein
MTVRTTQRLLEVVSVLALVVSGFVTFTALYGSNAVQDVEPMINLFSSHPSDWGTRARLLEIPAVQLILYAFGLLLARYSGALNFPIPVTPQNRFRLQVLAKSMISWLKAEVLILLACLQIVEVQVARGSRSGIPALPFQGITLLIFTTALVHYIAIRRQAPR